MEFLTVIVFVMKKICQAKFSKLIFNEVLSDEVLDILLQKFYIYLKCLPSYFNYTWTRYYQNNMLVSLNTYMGWSIYFYRTCISVYYLYRTCSSLFHPMMTDGKFFFEEAVFNFKMINITCVPCVPPLVLQKFQT